MPFLQTAGRVITGIGLIALAVLGIIYQDLVIGRPPAWGSFNPNPALAYLANPLLALAGLAIASGRRLWQAGLIAVLIIGISFARHLASGLVDWLNACKTFALLGGGLLVMASTKKSSALMWAGSLLLAIFFLASGYAHFKFIDFVTDFIPSYIPFHRFFAYFTAVCLLAGGVGIMIPKLRQLAALLCGIMLSGWFLLLHIPRFLNDPTNLSDRLGLAESFTFAGIFFLLSGWDEKGRSRH